MPGLDVVREHLDEQPALDELERVRAELLRLIDPVASSPSEPPAASEGDRVNASMKLSGFAPWLDRGF